MKQLTTSFLLGLALITTPAFAETTTWQGKLYNIMPKNNKVTADYCKAHVLDSYSTSSDMVNKDVKAENGVMAKEMKHKVRVEGDVYFISGTATFHGEYEGKKFSDKVNYYAHALKKNGMERGVWYTKDCKGFYHVGPDNGDDNGND